MKRELLNIEGGKIKKGNNVIFDDLSLELFQGEITGIVFDDILEQKLFIDMLLGDVLLYSGKIFVNEERKAYEEAARLLKQQVAVIGSKSKLLPSITIEDNIFLFSDRKLFLDQKEYRERFQKLRTELNISDDMPHKVRNLSAKEKVIIELLKAYEERKKIVILDEITSLLSEKDLGEVFSLIDKMKSQMSFLVTVGFEDFIMEWMESIAVVQNGRTTFVSGISQLNCKLSKVLKALIYENKAETFGAYGQKVINGQNNVLEVRDVSTCYLKNLNFTLCSGELLKIYYSDEKSKSSFWEMFSGEESIEEGQIYISEKLYKVSNMSQAVREGVGFITEAAGFNTDGEESSKYIPIYGIDALPEILSKIESGEITGSVLQDAKTQGQTIVKMAENLTSGKDAVDGIEGVETEEEAKAVRVPYQAITKDNLDLAKSTYE